MTNEGLINEVVQNKKMQSKHETSKIRKEAKKYLQNRTKQNVADKVDLKSNQNRQTEYIFGHNPMEKLEDIERERLPYLRKIQ